MAVVWRVRDRATFASLRREGRRSRRGPLTVTYLPAEPGTPPRVAYAIGTTVGSAVARNRLRRRLRALVATAELAPGAYLIGAGPAASLLDEAGLRRVLSEAVVSVAGTVDAAR